MSTDDTNARYSPDALIRFATELFTAAGCDGDKPSIIATGLVEADLLGHTTHGLHLAAPYLKEIANATMTIVGEPDVISDRGAAVAWDGKRLPGVWLTVKAVDLAIDRATKFGTGTVAIRRSHHIACLAAFLQRATDRGMMVTVASSDPAGASVAPYGGTKAVFTPDPIAVGIPTNGDPILIDVSASITTNGLTDRLRREGKSFPGLWAMDANGNATNQPDALYTTPPGTLLPTGGVDHGHKGYAMALMIEALTQGLGGFGRSSSPKGWGASVYVQVSDPSAFGGLDEFLRETSWTADACRKNPPIPGGNPVRLPGQKGLERKRLALKDGLTLYPGIMEALLPHAERLGVSVPKPMS